MKKFLSFVMGIFLVNIVLGFSFASAECDGIKLNTNIPFLGDCIKAENALQAFPTTIGALTKLAMSIILVVCFILIIVAGIMWAYGNDTSAKKMIKRVAWTIGLIGTSGAILRLINPNFFG